MKVKFIYPYGDPVFAEAGQVVEVDTITNDAAYLDGYGIEMPLNLFFKITQIHNERLTPKKSNKVSPMRVIELYNEAFAGTNAMQKLSPTESLKSSISARSKDFNSESDWVDLFEAVKLSPFLMGNAQCGDRKPFKLKIEWLIKPTNLSKVLDGYYHGE